VKLRRARSKQLAQFVVNIRMRPVDYWALTLRDRDAILREHNRVHRTRRGKSRK
jgi:hypothetical protein